MKAFALDSAKGNLLEIHVNDAVVTLPDGRDLFAIRQLVVDSGARVLVRGPSGKGKTTLLHLLAGIASARRGSVRVGGLELTSASEPERCLYRRRFLGMVFQKLNLFAHFTVDENLRMAHRVGELPQQEREACLARLGLGDTLHRRVGTLSLGEQQRVAVARAVLASPRVILADEPTSSLDDANADSVAHGLLSAPGIDTVMVVSHDHRLTRHFSDVREFDSFAEAIA